MSIEDKVNTLKYDLFRMKILINSYIELNENRSATSMINEREIKKIQLEQLLKLEKKIHILDVNQNLGI